MKLLSWNIRSGGGKRCDAIADAIGSYDADVVALSEYRQRSSAPLLRQLEDRGYGHFVLSDPDPNVGGVAIASRLRMVEEKPLAALGSEYFAKLSTFGYVDLWRREREAGAQEHTWYGPRHPYRIDHAFGSRNVLTRVERCWYSHDERERKISDHSIVLVELSNASVEQPPA